MATRPSGLEMRFWCTSGQRVRHCNLFSERNRYIFLPQHCLEYSVAALYTTTWTGSLISSSLLESLRTELKAGLRYSIISNLQYDYKTQNRTTISYHIRGLRQHGSQDSTNKPTPEPPLPQFQTRNPSLPIYTPTTPHPDHQTLTKALLTPTSLLKPQTQRHEKTYLTSSACARQPSELALAMPYLSPPVPSRRDPSLPRRRALFLCRNNGYAAERRW